MISAVAGTMVDLGLIPDGAEPETVPNSEDAAALEAHETAPIYEVELPDDLERLLDEPAFDDPDDDEPETIARYEDEEPDELARRLAKTERALTYERDQRLKVSRKNWEAEGTKYFPLADVSSIKADSRRAFLREARAQHQRTYTLLKPRLDEIEHIKQTAREDALAEERARVAGAYGRPMVGAGGSAPAPTDQERLAASRQKRDLRAGVRALIESGSV